MAEDKEGLLLTPEEVKQGISDYYWCDEMPMDTGISRENYAVAFAQLSKDQAHYEAKIEEAKKQERERIIAVILDNPSFRNAMVWTNPLVANTINYVIDTIRCALKSTDKGDIN